MSLDNYIFNLSSGVNAKVYFLYSSMLNDDRKSLSIKLCKIKFMEVWH